MMRPAAACWLAATVLVAGCESAPEPGPEKPPAANGEAKPAGDRPAKVDLAQLERAVKQAVLELGDAAPAVRDRALEKCITAGRPAVPWLKAARDKSKDRETRERIDRVLEALGEEGTYVTAIDRMLCEDFGAALSELERYRAFGRGRYGRQAMYLHAQVLKLQEHQARYPARAGGELRYLKDASPSGLWELAANNHNVYLFFKSRGVETPVFFERARDYYALAAQRDPEFRRAWACQAALFVSAGKAQGAKDALKRALALPEASGWDLMDLAVYHTAAGDADQAIAMLGKALARLTADERAAGRDADYPRWWASESNDFDALRSDPRFRELVRSR